MAPRRSPVGYLLRFQNGGHAHLTAHSGSRRARWTRGFRFLRKTGRANCKSHQFMSFHQFRGSCGLRGAILWARSRDLTVLDLCDTVSHARLRGRPRVPAARVGHRPAAAVPAPPLTGPAPCRVSPRVASATAERNTVLIEVLGDHVGAKHHRGDADRAITPRAQHPRRIHLSIPCLGDIVPAHDACAPPR